MAINNGYCTRQELKNHMMSAGGGSFTVEDDPNIDIAIEAISRLVDYLHQTTYYGATETRYFTAHWSDLLYVDDLISVTTLKTDDDYDGTYETTWATTDYWLEPRNARVKANAQDKRPYRQIRQNPNGDYAFPTNDYAIEIAGVWGYTTTVPTVIKQAVLLAGHRVFKRKDSIFGIAGTPALGVQVIQARIQQDSDIMQLLSGTDLRGFYG